MPLTPELLFWLNLYQSAWVTALPGLLLSSRLRQGWRERIQARHFCHTVDLWIQAASGGEAYLALEITKLLSANPGFKILLTSGTTQGLNILRQWQSQLKGRGQTLSVRTAYFPFDIPSLMKQAVKRLNPKLVVLLETELWPGLMVACQMRATPIVILNGRLSQKSLRAYSILTGFWRQIRPAEVYAVSREDAARFGRLFGHDHLRLMNNLKFDRIQCGNLQSGDDHTMGRIIPADIPFLVFGSIRREEEREIARVLKLVSTVLPQTVTGLFPRHMHRMSHWKDALDRIPVKWVWRSGLTGPVPPGTTILWDQFGELGQAYGRAEAVFVGGSLKPCGGQNFLEPLGKGVVPCVGPYRENFAWVGEEIFRLGLAQEVKNWRELVRALLRNLVTPVKREALLERVRAYIGERTGGTEQACEIIKGYLR